MPTEHLTKKRIDLATFAGKGRAAFVLWDDAPSGLGLRILPSGKKSFILQYRFEGRQRCLVLGQYGKITLDQARDLARERLHDIARGVDPAAVKEERLAAPTIAALATEYLERHAKVNKRSWRNDETQLRLYVLPAWGARKVTSITGPDVNRLHRKIGENSGPYQANRTLATLAKMFELARKWGILPPNAPNPARDVDKFPEQKRHYAIDIGEEWPRLADAIDAYPSVFIRAAILLLVHTGCRLREVLTAKWEQVDLNKKVLTLPHTKNGKPFTVVLSPASVALLAALPRFEENPYVLPGQRKGQHLDNVSKAWKRILQAAGLPATVRLHDLRHSLGTSLSDAGVSLTVVGRALNHSQPSVTARYAVPSQDPVRAALAAHDERLEASRARHKGAEGGELIPFDKTATE